MSVRIMEPLEQRNVPGKPGEVRYLCNICHLYTRWRRSKIHAEVDLQHHFEHFHHVQINEAEYE